jgi:hypothetical protein
MHILIVKNIQEFLFVIHTAYGKFMIFKVSFMLKEEVLYQIIQLLFYLMKLEREDLI